VRSSFTILLLDTSGGERGAILAEDGERRREFELMLNSRETADQGVIDHRFDAYMNVRQLALEIGYGLCSVTKTRPRLDALLWGASRTLTRGPLNLAQSWRPILSGSARCEFPRGQHDGWSNQQVNIFEPKWMQDKLILSVLVTIVLSFFFPLSCQPAKGCCWDRSTSDSVDRGLGLD
jgi:hypothetical protein